MCECSWSHCKYDDKTLNPILAAKYGNKYYHQECLQEKLNIERIKDLYGTEIDTNVVYAFLCRILKNIIFNKGNDSEFVLFAVEFAIKTHRPMTSPASLYYLVTDRAVLAAYKQHKEAETSKEIKEIAQQNIEIKDNEPSFTFTDVKQKTLEDLF